MTGRAWPSREEWQAKAEYAVRTFCTRYERLDRAQPDTVWFSLAEDIEFEELAVPAAAELRRLLTTEINRLRAKLPGRPAKSRALSAWFVELEGQAYEDACSLGALEGMRTDVQRARRNQLWTAVAWHLRRVRKHYTQIVLPDSLASACDRMVELMDVATARRAEAARAVEQSAIAKEVARRATDEAWQQEIERRANIDSPRVVRAEGQS